MLPIDGASADSGNAASGDTTADIGDEMLPTDGASAASGNMLPSGGASADSGEVRDGAKKAAKNDRSRFGRRRKVTQRLIMAFMATMGACKGDVEGDIFSLEAMFPAPIEQHPLKEMQGMNSTLPAEDHRVSYNSVSYF
jgi:hypothetical protein